MIHVQQCPVCNGTTFAPFLTCVDYAVSHETFQVIRCCDCNMMITSPQPPNDEISRYYDSPEYTSHVNKAKTIVDNIYVMARNFTLKWKMSIIEKYSVPAARKNILDFGCGIGEFLKVAKSNDWNTTGVEPSRYARERAVETISKDIRPSLADITDDEKTFHVITAWHVIEHVHELNKTIDTLKNLLRDNGTIFIAVPNHESWDARHYQQYWAAFDVPRHLWHFNTSTMTRMLSQHGFKVINVLPMRLDAYYVSLLSEKYKAGSLDISGMASSFLNGLRSNRFAKKNMQYSSLVYIATR